MRTISVVALIVTMLCCSHALAGSTYYVDPAAGKADGEGSQAKPWRTLAEVVTGSAMKKVEPGDTILLRSGYHGSVRFSGNNAKFITIAAAKGQKPTLSRLEIPSGARWRISGLTISPSFGAKPSRAVVCVLTSMTSARASAVWAARVLPLCHKKSTFKFKVSMNAATF